VELCGAKMLSRQYSEEIKDTLALYPTDNKSERVLHTSNDLGIKSSEVL
jgi:hypothetical protein